MSVVEATYSGPDDPEFVEFVKTLCDDDELEHIDELLVKIWELATQEEAADRITGSTPTNSRRGRGRPMGAKTIAIREFVLNDLVPNYDRMTVRQVFYAATVAGVVPKLEAQGYRPVQLQLTKMRREGLLSWDFIADGTRWMRKPDSWDDINDYIDAVSRSYRRDLWRGQDARIEIWLEKDALADVVVDVTKRWDVALMVSRGQSSVTFLHSAAATAEAAYEATGATTYVYALYDYDAGGDRAARKVEEDLPGFAPGVPIVFERLAVTPQQIAQWSLPTRPPKKSDPEAKKWGSKPAVELDAIDPNDLKTLVENAITSHVDERAWKVEKAFEEEERTGLLNLRDAFRNEEKR